MPEHTGLPLLQWGEAHRRADADAARQRRARPRRLLVTSYGTVLLIAPAILHPTPRLVWNASASMPIGFYWVSPGRRVTRGDIVLAWLPDGARILADRRRYVPRTVPLLKPIAATEGDRLCAEGTAVTINGHVEARRLRQDHLGRPLPWWRGCRTLKNGALFLLATMQPASFDGRYFGPIARTAVIGKARPLWVW